MQFKPTFANFTFCCTFVVIGQLFLFAGCRILPQSTGADQAEETVITFFYIVNKSGQDVKVRGLVDGREVFVQELAGKQNIPADVIEVPPPSPYPARELKVPLSSTAQNLEVEELNLRMQQKLGITGFTKVNGGFQVTIEAGKILIDQSYFPAR